MQAAVRINVPLNEIPGGPMRLFRNAAIVVFFGIGAVLSPVRAETVNLTLLFACDTYKVDGNSERGGFARLSAVVKAERAKGGHLVYAHGGDLISPSLLSGFDKGEHTIVLTNMAPPDIFTPGNHEFDFGQDVFMKRMEEARFPIFAANLRLQDGRPLPGFRDTEIKTFGSLKVGFIGLAADDSPVKSRPGTGLSFASTFDTGVRLAGELRKAGADIVVAVVHAVRETDMRLYASGAFDVILSGDDHDLAVLYDGKTAFVESMQEANYVTAIDLTVDISEQDGKRRVSWIPDFRIIETTTITPDPETQARVDAYNAELSQQLDIPVGTVTEPLDSRSRSVRTREAAMGNLVADAMRWAVDADAAIVNGGTIRGNTEYPAGTELTRRHILEELPFNMHTVKLNITGAAIHDALENGVGELPNPAGRFPQVSGMSFTIDIRKPKGQRVSDVIIGGKPLDPSARYTIATSDYLFEGGDGYTAFKQGKPLLGMRDGKLIANDVMAYMSSRKTVAPKIEGRTDVKM
jgi:2',3'-cyclic-nucleotide 2'-phosphodiesterase (5'-nucleotidase family)